MRNIHISQELIKYVAKYIHYATFCHPILFFFNPEPYSSAYSSSN